MSDGTARNYIVPATWGSDAPVVDARSVSLAKALRELSAGATNPDDAVVGLTLGIVEDCLRLTVWSIAAEGWTAMDEPERARAVEQMARLFAPGGQRSGKSGGSRLTLEADSLGVGDLMVLLSSAATEVEAHDADVVSVSARASADTGLAIEIHLDI